jgi:hypothetical protein
VVGERDQFPAPDAVEGVDLDNVEDCVIFKKGWIAKGRLITDNAKSL